MAKNDTVIPSITDILPQLRTESCVGWDTKVAIIDSGLDTGDSSLWAHVEDSYDLTTSNGDCHDRHPLRHGTRVAKIITSIAPGCRIFVVKVGNDSGFSHIRLLQALHWLRGTDAQLINLSLGVLQKCKGDCSICKSAAMHQATGRIVAAAAGNSGDKGTGTIECPGAHPKVLCVGATRQTGPGHEFGEEVAPYSGRGMSRQPKPDILAPGIIVNRELRPTSLQGTSFATPVVTGTIAALGSRFDVDDVISALFQTAEDLEEPNNVQGHGSINPVKALEVLGNG